jgi:D-alanyl-D-alanine carboxypeptidase (penicillin-binding protein 5/6)
MSQFLDYFFYQQVFKKPLRLFLLLFICLLPPTNPYFTKKVIAKKPIIRQVDIDLSNPHLYPVNITGNPAPAVSAYSVLVVDVGSKTVMLARHPDTFLSPASTTKMMTALVALDYFKLDDVLLMDRVEEIGQTMGLEIGEKISVKNLLYGLLVKSGNDAAFALADEYPGGMKVFVTKMNQKAVKLNLKNTQFKNPSGIDQAGHYSTVRDLVFLAREVIKKPLLAEMVATNGVTITDASGINFHELENVNQLLGQVPGVKGIKTGWTAQAGECLISLTERNSHQVIIGVLKSQDRFGESEKLINWVFDNFQWQEVKDYSLQSDSTAGT